MKILPNIKIEGIQFYNRTVNNSSLCTIGKLSEEGYHITWEGSHGYFSREWIINSIKSGDWEVVNKNYENSTK